MAAEKLEKQRVFTKIATSNFPSRNSSASKSRNPISRSLVGTPSSIKLMKFDKRSNLDQNRYKSAEKKKVFLSQVPEILSLNSLHAKNKLHSKALIKVDVLKQDNTVSKFNMFQKHMSHVNLNQIVN